MEQFWSAKHGHKKAVERLENRAKDLDKRSQELNRECFRLENQIKKIESDINKGLLEYYHLQGLNAHEYLNELRRNKYSLRQRSFEASNKAKRIKEYLNSITY